MTMTSVEAECWTPHDLTALVESGTLPFGGETPRSPEDWVMANQLRLAIWEALARLSQGTVSSRSAFIIALRFGLLGDRPYTLKEIGKILEITHHYEITPTRVAQVVETALRTLRQHRSYAILETFRG